MYRQVFTVTKHLIETPVTKQHGHKRLLQHTYTPFLSQQRTMGQQRYVAFCSPFLAWANTKPINHAIIRKSLGSIKMKFVLSGLPKNHFITSLLEIFVNGDFFFNRLKIIWHFEKI